jgi:hypothetical protein
MRAARACPSSVSVPKRVSVIEVDGGADGAVLSGFIPDKEDLVIYDLESKKLSVAFRGTRHRSSRRWVE